MGSAASGFGRGLPVCWGAISGQKGGFWAVLGGFRLPGKQDVINISGNPLNLARFEGNLGTNGTSWHHILCTTAPHIWHHGTTYLAPRHHTFGHHISKPILPILYLIFCTSYCTSYLVPHTVPYTVPHIWHLIFGTTYLAPQ